MKLLIVVPSYLPAYQFGGPIQSVHLLAKTLVKIGIKVTVYTTDVGQKKEICPIADIDGIKVIYFPFLHLFEFIGNTGWQFSSKMAAALKNNITNFDVVYIVSVWNFPSAAASYYCRKYNLPYVFSPRGQLYGNIINSKAWKKLPYYYLVSKRDIANASAIHYTSFNEYNSLHQDLGFNNRPLIIPNGIDLNEYKSSKNKQNFYNLYPHLEDKDIIIYLGRLNWKKGIDILINSFPKILNKYKNTHLLIAGGDEGNYKSILIGELKKLNVSYVDLSNKNKPLKIDNAKVTFTGYLNNELKIAALKSSKLFALISHSENFGMSIVEAMACDLPVVITDNVGIHDQIKEYSAGVFASMNSEDVAHKISRVLSDKELTNTNVTNAQKLIAEKYDIEKIAHLFSNSLKEFI